MQSGSKPPATLMAMAASNVAKKRTAAPAGRGAALARGAGGTTPNEAGLNQKMNEGRGHGHNFFSTTPQMGHAMSGTQLGQVDSTIQKAQSTLSRFRFAEGGKVAKTAGPSAKERREIRSLIEDGKADAVSALRGTRAALLGSVPEEPKDYDAALNRLSGSLALKEGGAVREEDAAGQEAGTADPELMYEEYTELIRHLQNPNLDRGLQMQMIDRLAQLEDGLEALGIKVEEGASAPPGATP
jgi:hypothetical protein